MRITLSLLALVIALASYDRAASAQTPTCLKPTTGNCLSFPKGGYHTGTAPDRTPQGWPINPGDTICVTGFVNPGVLPQFAYGSLSGTKWPTPSWTVIPGDYCFYK